MLHLIKSSRIWTHVKFLFKIDLKYLHLTKLYVSSLQMYNGGSVL